MMALRRGTRNLKDDVYHYNALLQVERTGRNRLRARTPRKRASKSQEAAIGDIRVCSARKPPAVGDRNALANAKVHRRQHSSLLPDCGRVWPTRF